jgi:hypothetical protein
MDYFYTTHLGYVFVLRCYLVTIYLTRIITLPANPEHVKMRPTTEQASIGFLGEELRVGAPDTLVDGARSSEDPTWYSLSLPARLRAGVGCK